MIWFIAGLGLAFGAFALTDRHGVSGWLCFPALVAALCMILYGLFEVGTRDRYPPIRPDMAAVASAPIAGSPLNTSRIDRAFRAFSEEMPQ
jgi:uncharacterized membrane protein